MNPDIPIVVIGYNRPAAMRRLLESIAGADVPQGIKLYISVDGEKEERKSGKVEEWKGGKVEEVLRVVEGFEWKHGEKVVIKHPQNLGLRAHVLSCGDLALDHDAVIVLEDDLVVSPAFYRFAVQAHQFYNDDERIGGISLYHHAYNETAQFPFLPLADGSDVYFLQYASSWGQVWSKNHWKGFRAWYDARSDRSDSDKLPPNIKLWPANSWKKFFIEYLIDRNLFFVFPRYSFTTIFGDEGTNIRIRETFLQVPLFYGERDFIFKSFESSSAMYDTYCEILPGCLKRIWKGMEEVDFEVDLYGMKPTGAISAGKMISGRRCKSPEKTFGREMKPQEENLLHQIPGNYYHFGSVEHFDDPPYLARLMKCHEKRELAYWYPIREYHFYGRKLLFTEGKSLSPCNPIFLIRKFLTMATFAFRYYTGKK